jgi:dTDP-4-dehydrorhamnose reductase
MRVVLFGGTGQLGSDIVRLWRDDEVVAPSRSEVAVEDRDAVAAALDSVRPEAVVNCTAFHNVDRCETEIAKAFEINAFAVEALANACAARNISFVTFSTDYVFDGELGRPYREDDAPNPINAYGVSKHAGEELVRRLQSDALIVRVCGLYGTRVSTSKGYTFVDRVLAQAREGTPLRVVADQTVSPAYTAHVATALRALLERTRRGIYHLVNEGAVTWYDFMREALALAGIERSIEPISFRDWVSPARRPAYSALENAAVAQFGIRMPGWRTGLADYLRDRAADRSA